MNKNGKSILMHNVYVQNDFNKIARNQNHLFSNALNQNGASYFCRFVPYFID